MNKTELISKDKDMNYVSRAGLNCLLSKKDGMQNRATESIYTLLRVRENWCLHTDMDWEYLELSEWMVYEELPCIFGQCSLNTVVTYKEGENI